MYEEKRPTCVTVIGWAWSILGGLMCLSAIFALLGSLMMGEMMGEGVQGHSDGPFVFRILPVLAIVQVGVGVLGLVAGINFLKLRAWSWPDSWFSGFSTGSPSRPDLVRPDSVRPASPSWVQPWVSS